MALVVTVMIMSMILIPKQPWRGFPDRRHIDCAVVTVRTQYIYRVNGEQEAMAEPPEAA